jgi:hypothetical protein
MESRTKIVRAKLANGQVVQLEVAVRGANSEEDAAEYDVASEIFSFDEVTGAIEEIAKTMTGTIAKVKPRKATVEFGLGVALEAGKLTALLVKGSGTASVKITLEWSEESAPASASTKTAIPMAG